MQNYDSFICTQGKKGSIQRLCETKPATFKTASISNSHHNQDLIKFLLSQALRLSSTVHINRQQQYLQFKSTKPSLSCSYLGSNQKLIMMIPCLTNLSSFQRKGKLDNTGGKKKKKKDKRPMNVQWLPSATDGQVRIKNKAEHHHHHTASLPLSNAPRCEVFYFTETMYFSNDHTVLTLIIKAAMAAKQGHCREHSIENTKTHI